jgi:hypothetical protein
MKVNMGVNKIPVDRHKQSSDAAQKTSLAEFETRLRVHSTPVASVRRAKFRWTG